MRQDEHENLRRRFGFRCGYCGVHERDVGAELTVDHYQPRSRGGDDEQENWVYCCHACNEYKGDSWQPDSPQRILHPIRDNAAAHLLEQEDATVRALSETELFHIETLHLNRRQLVEYRFERRRLEATRQTQARLLGRLQELEGQVQTLTAQIRQLEGSDPFA
jgi:HNH endonuclease